MAGFGGAVKLTGESEYRKALKQITRDLKEIASEQKLVASAYDKSDKSEKALSEQTEVLNKKYDAQDKKLKTLKAEYDAMNTKYADSKTKHEALVKSYDNEKSKLKDLAKEVGETSDEYKEQKDKVEKLAQEVKKSTTAQVQNENSMSKMRVEINKAQTECNKTAKEMDELGKETKDAGESAKKSANEGFTVFKGVLADLSATAIKSAIKGVAKLGGAVINTGKEALDSYADYEQLVGGVETLFKDNAKDVIKYSKSAYKTAGMSANTYMETVTSFSASMINSLGGNTKKATEYSNQAIIDMSDNANKMGTDIQSIQNAYQGFAKQNYSMLDNLKLGYGGTQKEMARLLNDAKKIDKDFNPDFSIDSKGHLEAEFSDVTKAIHIIQNNMKITGTTSKEAGETISGSVSSMKSAWQNMLTGIADDNADMGELIDNLVDSILTAGKNLLPRIKTIVTGGAKLVDGLLKTLVPEVLKVLPKLLNDTLPMLMKSVEKVIKSVLNILPTVMPLLSKLIPQIVNGLVSMLPLLLNAGIQLITALITGISKALPTLIKMLPQIIKDVVKVLTDNLPLIIDAGISLITALIEGLTDALPDLIEMLPEIVTNIAKALVKNAPKILKASIKIFGMLAKGLIKAIPTLIKTLPRIVSEVVKGLNKPLYDKFVNLWTNIKNVFKSVSSWFGGVFGKAWETIKGKFSKWATFWNGLWTKVKDKFKDIGGAMGGAISKSLKAGVNGILSTIEDTINDAFKMINSAIKIINKIPKVNISKIKELELPRLARGGIVSEPTIAEIGENGKEAIIPLENNTQWIRKVAGELAENMGATGYSKQNYNAMVSAFKEALTQVKVELDDKVAGRFVEKTVTRIIYN